MKKWIFALPLLACTLAGCGTMRSALEKLTDLVPGRDPRGRKIVLRSYVCRPSEAVRDTNGVELGLSFMAAPVGQSCDLGARQVYVAAVLRSEVEKARGLGMGQSVTIRGELAEWTPPLRPVAGAGAQPLNEAIVADSIHPNR